ncbi:hypothetical protein NV379_23420 [Paenibacillus sp. N1-5-1-14]|uniref:hypothetical protein n=1 Tax=Paenibacillus radicibacter TaxID=2972488 RepID=UPI0021590E3D|nr:hypothetical protein [Paenibacillus radicibacter]MCR8645593.1 hypothetical protein [Paenibacillus radicibacter]
MANQTANLGLVKPTENEHYDINIFNTNSDKIDATVLELNNKISVAGKVQSVNSKTGDVVLSAVDVGATKQSDYNLHVADYVKHPADGGTTAGTSTSYTVNSSPNPTALVDKIGVVITTHIDSGVNPKLTWGTLASVPILKPNGSVAVFKKDAIYTLRYSVVKAAFILQGEGGSGNATSADLLIDKTASTDVGDIVGTMPDRGTVNYTMTTHGQSFMITAGKHSGNGKITTHISNLTSDKIVAGETVGGVVGTAKKLVEASGIYTAKVQSGYAGGRFTISNLGFTPRAIFIMSAAGSYETTTGGGVAYDSSGEKLTYGTIGGGTSTKINDVNRTSDGCTFYLSLFSNAGENAIYQLYYYAVA